jgi:hypothetical protein
MEGMSLVVSAEATLEGKEATLNGCAKSCSSRTDFPCLSFDYCEEEKKCYFHKSHVMDNQKVEKIPVDLDSSCHHFSRNFEYDFHPHLNQQLGSSAKIMSRVKDNTLEECARACEELDADEDCLSFDFCESKGKNPSSCTFSSSSVVKGGKIPSDFCTTYERDQASIFVKNSVKSEKSASKSGYSSGAAAGVGILLLIVGSAIGVLAVFGYKYFYANRRVV